MGILKKIVVFFVLFVGLSVSAETLKAGVSKIGSVPNSFYGNWRVLAKIDKQSGDVYFKPVTVDVWNLSRSGDVINLNNPFTGASASVDLKLNGDTFTGVNYLTLETFSIHDKSLIKKDTAVYILKGEKISGKSITGK